jgi:hypothetical protein
MVNHVLTIYGQAEMIHFSGVDKSGEPMVNVII